jgi:hypothetical protein
VLKHCGDDFNILLKNVPSVARTSRRLFRTAIELKPTLNTIEVTQHDKHD